jgi:uncharacterized protein (DUF488 family)
VLFTIGYEGISLNRFFDLLVENEVQTLADVRINPLSRKPGFSKSALIRECASREINYRHFSALGCPRPILLDYRENKDWDDYTRRFWNYLRSEDSDLELALEEVGDLVITSRVALLCFEADFQLCHRSYVAEEVSQRLGGSDIFHITNQGVIESRCELLADR